MQFVKRLISSNLPASILLNINIPPLMKNEIKGIKITEQSDSHWEDRYEKRKDPFGRDYYWFAGEYHITADNLSSDDFALKSGYISVTPLQFNFSNSELIPKLRFFENIDLD